jgi:formylglycine-generating enzyme required for sulfatase activity
VIYALTYDWPLSPDVTVPRTPVSSSGPAATERDGKALVTYSTAGRPDKTKWIEPGSGESFQDCWKTASNAQACGPEMVVIPPGEFLMGSPENEEGRNADEGPQHKVRMPAPLGVGLTHVTRGEFAVFADATAHKTDGGRSERKWRRLDSWRL